VTANIETFLDPMTQISEVDPATLTAEQFKQALTSLGHGSPIHIASFVVRITTRRSKP